MALAYIGLLWWQVWILLFTLDDLELHRLRLRLVLVCQLVLQLVMVMVMGVVVVVMMMMMGVVVGQGRLLPDHQSGCAPVLLLLVLLFLVRLFRPSIRLRAVLLGVSHLLFLRQQLRAVGSFALLVADSGIVVVMVVVVVVHPWHVLLVGLCNDLG
jgi:hypothetical protein